MEFSFEREVKFSNNSSLKFFKPNHEFLDYIIYNFDEIFNLHPKYLNDRKSRIMLFNKDLRNPEWTNLEVNRWYCSYLKTPQFERKYKKSYMFSGEDGKEIIKTLPDILEPIYQSVKKIDERYNQVVVNWYKKENDYIALHSDWIDGMVDNYNIGIMSLYGEGDKIRYLDIINKETDEEYKIELNNGELIQMCGDFQNEFRHRVPKISDNDIISKRVSISFRQYK